MENIQDYSGYVISAYMVAAIVISGFALVVLIKYCRLKKYQNEK